MEKKSYNFFIEGLFMQRISNYISLSIAELKKVVWPTPRQAANLTVVVIIFSVIVAVIIGTFDFVFRSLLEKLLQV